MLIQNATIIPFRTWNTYIFRIWKCIYPYTHTHTHTWKGIVWKMKWSESHSVESDSLWLYNLWNSPGQNTGVGSLSLLQGMYPTQGLNPRFPHCRWILYQMSHKGSPSIQGWLAYPFSSRSSQPRNATGVSCIAGGFFTTWAIRQVQESDKEFITVSRQE